MTQLEVLEVTTVLQVELYQDGGHLALGHAALRPLTVEDPVIA